MATLMTRIKRLERKRAPKLDIAAILNAGRVRMAMGLQHPRCDPIKGNSPEAQALRAARRRSGLL